VRACADSSFIVRLAATEPDSPDTIAAYRHLGKPQLFFLSLHLLEVRNVTCFTCPVRSSSKASYS
jgi:hypothetical protein